VDAAAVASADIATNRAVGRIIFFAVAADGGISSRRRVLVDVLPPPGRLLILLFGDESNNATTFLPRSGSDGAITLVLWLAAVLNENAVLVLNTSIAKAIGNIMVPFAYCIDEAS
jgi:hypothetical protein